ncbi:hypothetical protein GCM10027341_52980 [Spirosoma knui]
MIQSSHLLITGLNTPLTRVGRQRTTDDTVHPKRVLGAPRSYLAITFAGITRTYVNLGPCQFFQKDPIELWSLKAGAGHDNFLSIAVSDQWSGSFAFGRDQPQQERISIVTYGLGQFVFSSCYTRADQPGEYLLTQGMVQVKHDQKQMFIKGMFLGTLMPLHTAPSLAPISGHFCLTR